MNTHALTLNIKAFILFIIQCSMIRYLYFMAFPWGVV